MTIGIGILLTYNIGILPHDAIVSAVYVVVVCHDSAAI